MLSPTSSVNPGINYPWSSCVMEWLILWHKAKNNSKETRFLNVSPTHVCSSSLRGSKRHWSQNKDRLIRRCLVQERMIDDEHVIIIKPTKEVVWRSAKASTWSILENQRSKHDINKIPTTKVHGAMWWNRVQYQIFLLHMNLLLHLIDQMMKASLDPQFGLRY